VARLDRRLTFLVHGYGMLVGVVDAGVQQGGGRHRVRHQFMHRLLLRNDPDGGESGAKEVGRGKAGSWS